MARHRRPVLSRRVSRPVLRRRLVPIVAGAAVAGTLGMSALPAASAASIGTPHVTVLNRTALAPYQLAFARGRLYVGDGGTSVVSRLRGHVLDPLVRGPQPGEVAGVAVDSRGDLAYTSTDYKTGATALTIVRVGGRHVVADLSGFEKAHNPDGRVTYGIVGPASACARAAIKKSGAHVPLTYKGVVDSHPYAVTPFKGGWWLVADAAGNDILKVSPAGRVFTVAVLPRQKTLVTPAVAKANGAPPCVVGVTYVSEPVPTDLEFGPHGALYVSTLAGGIAQGSVYTVDTRHHTSHLVATGFRAATNLTVTPRGVVYVAELGANRISVIVGGRRHFYVSLKNALSVEYGHGILYAGTLAPGAEGAPPTGPGSIVAITR